MSKIILITGTSSGIGPACVRHFSATGWNVVATMRNPEKEQELTKMEDVLVTALNVHRHGLFNIFLKLGKLALSVSSKTSLCK